MLPHLRLNDDKKKLLFLHHYSKKLDLTNIFRQENTHTANCFSSNFLKHIKMKSRIVDLTWGQRENNLCKVANSLKSSLIFFAPFPINNTIICWICMLQDMRYHVTLWLLINKSEKVADRVAISFLPSADHTS